MEVKELSIFNPWWKTGEVPERWLKPYRRKLYYELSKYMDRRQILVIQGLRRVGKTTLMFQLIQELLDKGTAPENILYFSFDEMVYDVKEVVECYQNFVLSKPFEKAKEKVYIFLDEIQKVKNWENQLKLMYDLYPNLKFIISGSSTTTLKKRSKESLAGRIIDFTLHPLSFEEFLELNGIDVSKIRRNPDIWERDVLPLFYRYLKWGSFPELATEEDEHFARKYLLNSVIERIIYRDIPEEFGIKDLELLKKIVHTIGKSPGMLVNYRELSKNFGRDVRTISNYLEYLEHSMLIKFLFNFRGSPLASMRKLKKVYFTTPNFVFAFNPSFDDVLPKALENLIASLKDVTFFYHDSFEVDFIKSNGKITAIEVKLEGKKLKQLKKFVSKFEGSRAIIVDLEREGTTEGFRIVPAWKFLLGL